MFCGLLILLLSACLYSIFCRRHDQSHYHHGSRPEHSARMQEDHLAALTNASGIGETVVGRMTTTVSTTTTAVRHNPPPPPYHIAILIPPLPPTFSDEAPPPSYDKVCDEIAGPAWNSKTDSSKKPFFLRDILVSPLTLARGGANQFSRIRINFHVCDRNAIDDNTSTTQREVERSSEKEVRAAIFSSGHYSRGAGGGEGRGAALRHRIYVCGVDKLYSNLLYYKILCDIFDLALA